MVTLLEQKRSQQVGMLQQRVRKDMEAQGHGKDLREAIMEVDAAPPPPPQLGAHSGDGCTPLRSTRRPLVRLPVSLRSTRTR